MISDKSDRYHELVGKMRGLTFIGRRGLIALPGKVPVFQRPQRPLSDSSQTRSDPTTKRPNRVCDPYGQSGKPLSRTQVQSLRATLHNDWRIGTRSDQSREGIIGSIESLSTSPTSDSDSTTIPISLTREFCHPDFLTGSRFLQSVAAVAEMNAHFPSLHLERRIVQKHWRTVSSVTCHTVVLGGLATHDFHLAMLIDVEVDRPEIKKLYAVQAASN